MSNINFDDFEREIRHAESYLNSASTKAQDDLSPTHAAEQHHDTIFFASDLQSEPYGHHHDMINFGSSSAEVPSSSTRAADPLIDTIRFGAGSDSNHSIHKYETESAYSRDPHAGDLFYASDVLGTESRRFAEDEEMLSFLPSPQQSQHLDQHFDQHLDQLNSSQVNASLADTVRFTKPVETALRSMDNTYSNQQHRVTNTNTSTNINTNTNTNTNNSRPVSTGRLRPTAATTNTNTNTRNSYNNNQSPKFVRTQYVPETFGPRRTANAISMERIEELHRKRVLAKQELLKKKRALDELQLAECTFKPQISRGTRAILHQKQQFEQLEAECRGGGENVDENNTYNNNNNNTNTNTTSNVSERLYREASIRNAQQHWINVQVQHLRNSEYTFRPSLHTNTSHNNTSTNTHTNTNTNTNANTHNNTNTSNKVGSRSVEVMPTFALDRRPIHERIADMMKEKKQYLLALKTSIEEEQVDLTFQPRIDARSRAIAEQKLMGYGANHYLSGARGSVGVGGSSGSTGGGMDGAGGGGNISNSVDRGTVGLSGEQQMALVMGFHTDVGSRLIDQGRAMAKRKQQLVHERDNELAVAMEQVAISKGSAKIVQKGDLRETFEQRQAQYKQRERERHDAQLREREHLSSNWFKPQIDPRSSTILHAHRPELSLESVEQKATRLSVHDAQELESRRVARAAAMYGAIPFSPQIDALSRSLGRSSSIEELVTNRRAVSAREKIRQRVEEELNQECTFRPQINALSKQLLQPSEDDAFLQKYNSDYAQVGWAQNCELDGIEPGIRDSFTRAQNGRINMAEPEKMQRDIRMHALHKEEKRRSELIAREIQDLRECTFHPDIDSSLASLERQKHDNSPVVVRGLGRFLELKHLTVKQKEDALQREREVFSVRNIDQYRRAEDGSTVVQAFNFNLTEPRQHSRLDISGVEISPGSLNASTIMSHKSHRQPTSSAAAAAWCM